MAHRLRAAATRQRPDAITSLSKRILSVQLRVRLQLATGLLPASSVQTAGIMAPAISAGSCRSAMAGPAAKTLRKSYRFCGEIVVARTPLPWPARLATLIVTNMIAKVGRSATQMSLTLRFARRT
jgi:hypothetical protein